MVEGKENKRLEKSKQQVCSTLLASCWFRGLHFDPEEGGSVNNQDIEWVQFRE
jgi:hypothetical protein